MSPGTPMIEWKALSARISLFPAAFSSSPPSPLSLYKAVWEGDPDTFRKQSNPLMPNLAQAKIGSLIATCTTHQSRIDFTLLPIPPTDGSVGLIGDTTQLHEHLLRIIGAVGNDAVSYPAARVAIFLQFVTLASGFLEANSILMETIPVPYRIKITDEEDFILQINQPDLLGELGRMNFIRKWSTDRYHVFNLTIPTIGQPIPEQLGQPPVGVIPKQFFAASVTFDHNNVPGPHPIANQMQAMLLKEGLTRAAQMQRECGMNIAGF